MIYGCFLQYNTGVLNFTLVILGKIISYISQLVNLGYGSTWPGHVALNVNKNFIKEIVKANPQLKIILIAGTNGKTTTCKLIQTILETANYRVFQNESGANLLNGIASSMLLRSSILSTINYDYAIFEVDEATLPLILKEIFPHYLILLNLFRDQLDRYGEVNTIASKWREAIKNLSPKTQLILNADDPQVALLGLHRGGVSVPPLRWKHDNIFFFGLNDKTLHQVSHQHAVDSTYCPNCNSKLRYHSIYYSHLGDWECTNCQYKRPKNIFATPPSSKLTGTYNLYNILAATLLAKKIGISEDVINNSLNTFLPAFGRQEILKVDSKKVQIFLSKNPTSFNESLRTIASLGAKNVLFVLNDRIPDGRDVSWIWDVDFEDYVDELKNITVSGDRCYDMRLRIKYAERSEIRNSKFEIKADLKEAIKYSLDNTSKSEMLYVLPTYSAMLRVRKILTGKKIL